MDMSKVNMHKRLAMTGNAPDVPAKAGHFRGGGLAKRGLGKALQEGGLTGAEFKDRVGRSLGRRTRDAEGRAMMQPMRGSKRIPPLHPPKKKKITKRPKHHQGYKAREDESLGMRTGKESGKKQSMKDRRDESYGKWGSRPNQRINRAKGGSVHRNTRRENILEEKGRVDAEKAYTSKGKRALKGEQRRLARELGKKEGGFLARRKKLGSGASVAAALKLKLLQKLSKKRKK